MSKQIDDKSLTMVGDVVVPDYSWSAVGVWHDGEGFYLGTDAGCSCNSPWEDYYGTDPLTGPLTAEQAVEEVISLTSNSGYYGYDQADVDYLVEAIRAWR